MIYIDSSGLNDIIVLLWEKEVKFKLEIILFRILSVIFMKVLLLHQGKNQAEILKNVFYIINFHKPLTQSSFSIWHNCFLSEMLYMAKEQKIICHVFFLFSDFFSIDWYIYGTWIQNMQMYVWMTTEKIS